jgi:TonB family protein
VEFVLPVSFKLETGVSAPAPDDNKDPVVVTALGAKEGDQSEIYKVVEEMPRFPGCEESGLEGKELQQCAFGKLIGFIQERMKYPEEAKKAGIEGRTVVSFVVTPEGKISDPKIVRSIGYGSDAVVLDIVKAMPAWRPGYQKGKAVGEEMNLPISFVLPAGDAQSESKSPRVSGDILNIQVFPVPSGDQLNYTIDLPAGSGIVVIELLSSNGNVVLKDNKSLQLSKAGSHSGSFNINNVTPGTYVIRAQWEGNVVTKSVVIQ